MLLMSLMRKEQTNTQFEGWVSQCEIWISLHHCAAFRPEASGSAGRHWSILSHEYCYKRQHNYKMLISVIQATKSSLPNLKELVDKHFQDGDFKTGCVLIQGCEGIKVQLKNPTIKCTKQTFKGSHNAGAFLYQAGKIFCSFLLFPLYVMLQKRGELLHRWLLSKSLLRLKVVIPWT